MPDNHIAPDKHMIIDISKIDIEDQRYKVSLSDDDISHLSRSIKSTGLISPLLLRPVDRSDYSYVILSGFNRMRALIYNRMSTASAILLDGKQTEVDYHNKAIAAVAFKRALSHAELIRCLKRLSQYCTPEKIAELSIPVFNTPLNIKFIKDLLAISQLPDPTCDLIHQGLLSIKSAKRLIKLADESIGIFLTLFSKIKASSSKQLEIITFMIEISARDGQGIKILYQDLEIQTILSDDQTPPGVKTNQIRAILFKKRFPAIFKSRKMADRLIAALNLGKEIKFTPPENLEGLQFSLSFTARTADDFKDRVKKLNLACDTPELNQIFNS